ncbi:MAG: hypothetical protein Q4D76_18170 [Oscillospiraceae bacterium]|nr:hypothetical protein [Oscillospiraceae bacterium]
MATAKLVSKQTLNTGLAPVIKAVQNSTQNSRESYQTKLNNYKKSGSAQKMVGTFYQGVIDSADNMVSALYNLCDDPLGTAMESVCYFCSDPLKNNPVGAVRQYCSDVSKSIKEQDWNTVSYKLGQGFFNTAAVVPGAKVTKGTVPGKVSSGSGIGSSVRNSLNSMFDGTPALVGTNGMVIAGAVPEEISVASTAVASASGVVAGAAVGQIQH